MEFITVKSIYEKLGMPTPYPMYDNQRGWLTDDNGEIVKTFLDELAPVSVLTLNEKEEIFS